MSRWWAERLRIGLAPQRVELARLRWLSGAKAARESSVSCAPQAGEPPWLAALQALEAPLAEAGARGAAVTVVLSNHFVRYLVLPWQPKVLRAAEVEQLARLRFAHRFGATAQDWTIRCSDAGYGAAQLACAVDTALITDLRARLAAHGMRLVSMQPLLMAGYNAVRRELATHSALAIVEAGRVCLGLRERSQWLDVTSRRAGVDLADAIEQELATREPDASPVLDVLLVGEGAAWPAQGMPRARLLGKSQSGFACSLAMCGAT